MRVNLSVWNEAMAAFTMRCTFPGNIDPGAIRAEYRRGVLRVTCPKSCERIVPITEITAPKEI